MLCSLQQSFPPRAFRPRRIPVGGELYTTLILRCSVQSDLREEEEAADSRRDGSIPDVILVERYGNGTSKRYLLRDDSPLQAFLEEHDNEDNKSQGSASVDAELPWLPSVVKDFILPAGFPGSVSDDYLEYMLLQFPTNVTGWICHAIVTSSLLKAVGIGTFSGTSAAASAAAIRWVSKDGIGAVGRFLIGGRFGNLFDDDPKQWRMYADFIGSAGSIFDLSTQLFPAYFLPLASMGSLTKAIARALKDPSFRVIQNHFAISRNLGEVAAKEEVWEVAAQLIGLGLGVAILDTPGLVKAIPILSLTWMSMRFLHLYLRYLSLSVLRFDTINLKRARILVHSHVTRSLVPGCVDGNKQENILLWEKFMKPQIVFAAPLEEMIGQDRSVSTVKTFLRIYRNEKFILAANRRQNDFKVFISYKVGATGESVLRSLWQTYWLHNNMGNSDSECGFDELKKSLVEMETRFHDFIEQLQKRGWNVHETNLKIPTEILIDEQIQA